ncbi:MAG: YCF48-related protein [Bacteroidales bacterium]
MIKDFMPLRSIYFVYSILLIWFLSLEGSAQFEVQYSGTNNDLTAIHFPDKATGYVCGKDGTFLKTRDGGRAWSNLSLSTVDNLNGLYFKNPDTGFVIGENNIFMKTMNGGYT